MKESEKSFLENEGLIFNNAWDQDNITEHWVLSKSPYPILFVVVSYLAFILKYGRNFMDSRDAFRLKAVVRIYNLFQIIVNIGILVRVLSDPPVLYCLRALTCSLDVPEFRTCKHYNVDFLTYFWGYLVLKIVDLTDTVFMVLRKKYKHITFLHVYHHIGMVVFTWITFKYIKNHQAIVPGIINTFVHAVMYSYYFLATFSRWRPILSPWKPYLTRLQLGQFVVILVYFVMLYRNECQVSKVFTYIWVFNVFVIFLLFLNFYIKLYILPRENGLSNKIKKAS